MFTALIMRHVCAHGDRQGLVPTLLEQHFRARELTERGDVERTKKVMFRWLVPRHQAKVAATTRTKKTAAATARQKKTPQRPEQRTEVPEQ